MFSLFKNKKQSQPAIVRRDEHGYVGKTRLRPDFLKKNINSRESVALDHWIQEGFANANRQIKIASNPASNGETSLFYMAGGESESSLVGVIKPSLDSSGRYYPFVSFVHCGQDVIKLHPSMLFMNNTQSIESLIGVTSSLHEADSTEKMDAVADHLKPIVEQFKQSPNINEQVNRFRQIPMSVLWQAIGYDDVNDRAQLIHESSAILQSMANRGCLRSQFGLRFPMPHFTHENAILGAFWLHLVTMIVADHNWRPWFFYHFNEQSQQTSMTIFARPVPASCFESIWHINTSTKSVVDLTSLTLNTECSEKAMSLAKMDNVSMYDALRRWCKA
ncbi:type VI secretion system-associated protein TagF [Flocculibacter collagenilyticus]|uniref:type VI secretion system-associated protein TagF n=1 Tax=Flocculibacter collagenilyticus TaxID=2744479 RepID=UPI0018F360E4|nr:type VI secretion system-associated protein TagF [Flocculibacter collagenilyticus]